MSRVALSVWLLHIAELVLLRLRALMGLSYYMVFFRVTELVTERSKRMTIDQRKRKRKRIRGAMRIPVSF
tara:strand:- start:288 stop:497 length:210 start_codon:yes stop_codon:yes gene_type:complete